MRSLVQVNLELTFSLLQRSSELLVGMLTLLTTDIQIFAPTSLTVRRLLDAVC